MRKLTFACLMIWATACFAEAYVSPYRTIQAPNQFGYDHDVVYPGEPGYDELYGPHGVYSKEVSGTPAASSTDAVHPFANGKDCMTLDHRPVASGRWLHASDGKWYYCENGTWAPQVAKASTPAAPATPAPKAKAETFQQWRARMHANAASLDVFGYNRNLSVADEFAARNYRRAHPLEFSPFGFH